jgi:nucleotide-binding universal stress UspA family protein
MNVPFAHIACCVEHESSTAEEILAAGRALQATGTGELTVVHVIAQPLVYPGIPGMGMYWGSIDLTEIQSAAQTWVEALTVPGEKTVVLEGYPPAAVSHWAADAGVDLLVIAVTRRMIERVFLGSFATYLAHNAPCPVLMVRPVTAPDTQGTTATVGHVGDAR